MSGTTALPAVTAMAKGAAAVTVADVEEARGQVVAADDPRLAGRTAAQRPALPQQPRTRRAVDRAVDAPAAPTTPKDPNA